MDFLFEDILAQGKKLQSYNSIHISFKKRWRHCQRILLSQLGRNQLSSSMEHRERTNINSSTKVNKIVEPFSIGFLTEDLQGW